MSAWLDYLQREVGRDILDYIPDQLAQLTERCRRGKEMLLTPDLPENKKQEYESLIQTLMARRDFFAALLRYREEELPSILGPRWKREDMDEIIAAIFQRHTNWVHYWYPTNELSLPENAERMKEVQAAANGIFGTEKGKSLMANAFDRFAVDYDYSDLPHFYLDICICINEIGKYQLAVWTAVHKMRLKTSESPKQE